MRQTSTDVARYVRRETTVSVLVNAILSLLIFLATFGWRPVAMWGLGQWVFDFIPQSFMVALMSALVPGLLTAARMRRGAFVGAAAAPPPLTVALRAFSLAAGSALIGPALVGSVVWAMGLAALAPAAALGLKVLYGVLLALLITPHAVRAILKNTR